MYKSKTTLVSIVIPTYNHAQYLSRALRSVLDQTYIHWEAIVVDNHSTDGTDEIMRNFKDLRIKYLKIFNEGVIAKSRNAGIKASNGEWIAFLDSDDWWTSDKLQECVNNIDPEVDLIYHDLDISSNKLKIFRRKIIKPRQVNSPVLIDLIINRNALATSSVMVRKNILNQIGGMNESPGMVAAEDYNTWLRIAKLTNGFKHLSKTLGFYQLNNQGVSSQKDMSIAEYNATINFLDLLNVDQLKEFNSDLNYKKGRYSYLRGEFKDAKFNLKLSFAKSKFMIKLKIIYMIVMMKVKSYKSN